MRIRTRTVTFAAALAFVAAGCGNDKCPTEPPEVSGIPTDCQAATGQAVTYPLHLCPTCNQTFSSCDVQMSGNDIFLNPTVEACTSSSSCGAGCSPNTNACTFTAPAPGDYIVSAYDAAHPSQPRTGTLHVLTGGPVSCAF